MGKNKQLQKHLSLKLNELNHKIGEIHTQIGDLENKLEILKQQKEDTTDLLANEVFGLSESGVIIALRYINHFVTLEQLSEFLYAKNKENDNFLWGDEYKATFTWHLDRLLTLSESYYIVMLGSRVLNYNPQYGLKEWMTPEGNIKPGHKNKIYGSTNTRK